MFFPIADTPNPAGRPYVTWGLMAVNIAVYLLISLPASAGKVDLNDPLLWDYLQVLRLHGQVTARDIYQHVSAYDLLVFRYGFRPAEFSPLALFTSLFLHGGFMHLAGNMLFLYIFGDNVECRLGRIGYLLTYLGCGVIATLFFSFFAAGSQVPLIGASGAIFGVLGCYFLWFPRNRVRCFIFLFPFIMTSIYLSARLVLGFYLVIDNLLPFVFTAKSGSGIAHGAHIGGFFAGLAIAWGADRYYLLFNERKHPHHSPPDTELASLRHICPAVQAGEYEQAAACYLALPSREQRQQVAGVDVIAVGEHLFKQGRFQDALGVFRRFIAERPNDKQIAEAYLGAGKVMMTNPRYMTSAYHYFLSANDLADSEQTAVEAKRYLRQIEAQRRQKSGKDEE
ncbi:MAG: rhomboid family intramembrane serine protease [Desulfuromonadales bacterium]|nr:rhomboid family intramembrane serine protease [Desulfuromonadales bacterium]MBN2792008.1 rhomboid family intramembrane serine protease [Desulfuromonadales bacterium]